VPRTWAVRQELEAWGQQQSALPLLYMHRMTLHLFWGILS
jgi:hypothetical protein